MKQIILRVVSIAIISLAGFGGYSIYQRYTVMPPEPVVVEKIIEKEVPVIVEKEVPVIVEKEVLVEVPVPTPTEPAPAAPESAPTVNQERDFGERVWDYFTTIRPVPGDRTMGRD